MKHSTLPLLAATVAAAHFGGQAFAQAAPGDTDSTMDPDQTMQPTTPTTTPNAATDTTRAPTTDSAGDPVAPGTATTSPGANTTMDSTSTNADRMDNNRLPSTATPLWLLGFMNGLGVAGLAAVLRMTRRLRAR